MSNKTIYVFNGPEVLSRESHDTLERELAEKFGAKCVVLPHGVKLAEVIEDRPGYVDLTLSRRGEK